MNFLAGISYASDPQSGKVVEEFEQMVDAFHQAGIAVVIDVVYNHVGIPHIYYI